MLRDVLTAIQGSPGIAGTLLVTRDRDIAAIARGFGARVLMEKHNRGYNEAVTWAAEVLCAEKVASMLTLAADLPLLDSAELEVLIGTHATSRPAVTVAPARDKLGSNALLCSPPTALPFQFGENSFFAHLRAARELGIKPAVVERPGLGLDIDTPADLRAFAARPTSTHAYDFLSRAGLLAALASIPDTSGACAASLGNL
jgi:2-phospho-L-lactate guanylyltransferase